MAVARKRKMVSGGPRRTLERAVASGLIAAAIALAAPAAAAPPGPHCNGGRVVTGTAFGAFHTRALIRTFPEVAQLAALVATVDEEQESFAEGVARERLRKKHSRYEAQQAFDFLLAEARSGRNQVEAFDGVAGATAGAVAGLMVGPLVNRTLGPLGGATFGGVLGAKLMRGVIVETVKIPVDRVLVQIAMDQLLDDPCNVSAADALVLIKQNE